MLFSKELEKIIEYIKHIEEIPDLDKYDPLTYFNYRDTLREDRAETFETGRDIRNNFPMNDITRLI